MSDRPPVCIVCENEFTLDANRETSADPRDNYCDPCAQAEVLRLRAENATLRAAVSVFVEADAAAFAATLALAEDETTRPAFERACDAKADALAKLRELSR